MSAITRRRILALGASAIAAAAFAPGVSMAQAVGYAPVAKPVDTSAADKVEVLEFFWLGCPHCYHFEPYMLEWKANMPDTATFVREAPPLNPSWEPHSRGFYAARDLDIEDTFVKAMFTAIHVDGERMRNPEDIAKLAATLGADEAAFLDAMQSSSVDEAMSRSTQMAVDAGITGVPSVMIDGKYLTSGALAGSEEGVIQVIDNLVEAEAHIKGL